MNTTVLPELDSLEFIEMFYPNYHGSDEIKEFLDLQMYLDGALTKKGYLDRIGRPEYRPKARLQFEYYAMEKAIQHKALVQFYEKVRTNKALSAIMVNQ